MKFFRGIWHVLMDQAGDGTGGGASSGGSAAASSTEGGQQGSAAEGTSGVPAGGNADGQGTTGTGQGAAGTALSQGAGEAGQQGQAVAIPEKYQVKKEDGTLDIEASSQKLAEAYGHLEKRMGSGDLPPKTAEEYAIEVPDALKETWNPKDDPLLGDFLKDAHAAGLTQKQVDLVMGKYFEMAPALVNGSRQLSADECVTDLRSEWKTEDQYKAEVGKAYKAAMAYGDKDADAIIKDYGNDPRIVRFMARVGNELGEDRSLNPGGSQQGGQSVESLMQSEAYNNPKHADHARISAQVQRHFQSQADANARSGNVPIL